MTDEVNAAQGAELTATESAPEEQNTVEETESSQEETESELDLNTSEESAEEDVNVPLHENPRFKEVYQNMKTFKEESEQLRQEIAELKQASQPSQSQTSEETVPDYLYQVNPETGETEINTEKYIDWKIQNGVNKAISNKDTEGKIWAETYEAYPQLKEDSELKSMVEKGAFAEWQMTGKAVHPKDYAKRLFDRFAQKKQEGARIAQENSKVVDQAYLESNSPASNRERTLTNSDLAKATPDQIHKWELSGDLDRALRAGTLKGTPLA